MTTDELKRRDVINIRNAANYGTPRDFGVDICDGQIKSIIICPSSGMFSFKKGGTLAIPWHTVVKIGDGAILVDFPVPKCAPDNCKNKSEKKNPFF